MPSLSEIFHALLLPAVIVAASLAIASLSLSWMNRPRDCRWLGAVAVSAGFAVGEIAIGGAPRWPPGEGDVAFWLVWLTVPVAVLGLLDAMLTPPNWLRVLILYVLARLGARAMLAPLALHSGPDPAATLWSLANWVDGLAAVTVVWWLALEAQAEKMHRSAGLGVLVLVTGGATALFALSNNVTAAQSAAALTAISVAIALLAWPFQHLSPARGVVLALIVPLLGRWLIVHFYAFTEPPIAAVALFLVAPLLVWVADLPGLRRIRRGRIILQLLPVVLAMGIAAAITARQSAPAPPGSSNAPEDY